MAITRGMASPSACGHAMTSTVTTRSIANAGVAPSASHTTAVVTAEPMATSVNDEGRPIRECLRARAGRLRLRDEARDARERGAIARSGDLDAE